MPPKKDKKQVEEETPDEKDEKKPEAGIEEASQKTTPEGKDGTEIMQTQEPAKQMQLYNVPDGPLAEIDFTGVKYPLKEMVMRFLLHADSLDQCISDEIILKFPENLMESQSEGGTPKQKTETILSSLCPTTFIIHETFPILLLQDNTHFASFCLTKELYEDIKERQISTQYFSEMAQYSLKIRKVRIQMRRVHSKDVFTQYMGVEIRIIITDGEITEASLKNGMIDSRKNWWMKSLYRDDDVRTLIQQKFHSRMVEFIDKEPEFDDWPTGGQYFTADKTLKFDGQKNTIVQPEATEEEGKVVRPKAIAARDMYFETLQEVYDDKLTPYDCEDVLVFEKGQEKYNEMLQNRKEAEEKRKQQADIIINHSKIYVRNGDTFNTEEERKRAQERQQQRQNRNEIKEMAEQVKIQFFQLQSWQKHFPKLLEISDEKAKEIQRRSRRSGNAPVPPRLHLTHTKRFVQWFRENVINDPLIGQNQVEKNKQDVEEQVQTDFSEYYAPNHDFGVTIIQRSAGAIPLCQISSQHEPSAIPNRVSSNAPSQPASKRTSAPEPKIETKPLHAKNPQKFGINKTDKEDKKTNEKSSSDQSPSKKEEQKALKEEDDEPKPKASAVGIKRKMGGLSGLGGSLKKQKT